ncbi:glycosyltransferase [Streptacidiphilus jiangxiensis]|uniref:D-inositol 3-phosphate glycosyltransferase n=1 Tax=Streptacidiphilus jiangxiensis TaxID=235985 RepID=A0A1H7VRW2_STRJI|nr:glycosyltransferase [Streptacidiphilus jiangxiensis]SEM11537.1 Glycosyltransferase involved in cell wall bisynthesis [Streptacidiphilus jiangxiensis]
MSAPVADPSESRPELRVLHVVTGLHAGGAEQQLRLLLRHLPPGIHCEVVALCEAGTVADGLRADGVTVHELDMRGNRDLAAVPRLVRLIREGRYDLVHCHLYRACVYGRLAARLAGVRAVLATEHSLQPGVLEGRRTSAAVRRLYLATERLGRVTIAVSEATARQLRTWDVPDERIRVVPNGIDPTAYRVDAVPRASLGLPADAFVIGAVGRLVPGKRFDVLVDALTLLPPQAHLLIVGTGPERDALLAQAGERGVGERVVLTGERDDVPGLLATMDALAAPSAGETFGLVLVEGLAAGLPVFWSSGPALAELPMQEQLALGRGGSARTEPTPSAYAAALAPVLARRPPRTVGPVPARYDIARLAPRVAAVYAELAGVPEPRHRIAPPKEMSRAR